VCVYVYIYIERERDGRSTWNPTFGQGWDNARFNLPGGVAQEEACTQKKYIIHVIVNAALVPAWSYHVRHSLLDAGATCCSLCDCAGGQGQAGARSPPTLERGSEIPVWGHEVHCQSD